ncbi:ferredoxin reductase [Polymorphobacter sp. PAMC 29334]|uniref:ferredoxin reductase n=1 Tax=Polymorphobacter sp. PAMC 29334 TaxID=2862331 RepID=UPI001C79A2BA|nr:ferredoxin reductase [Polymorphobacter sp. PAMC 29334]QYE35653.1 ferredoxin reductase [Polymorphobacter sp. PAMC 29334]
MTSAALLPLRWRTATVIARRPETPHVATLVLDVPGWPGHKAGQHVDLRLTAADGYEAQRSYSIASANDGTAVAITVERVADGEVSPFLLDDVRVSDDLELRGPIGGYFVWSLEDGNPLLLIAGGSGVAPMMSILRARAQALKPPAARLLYSSRDQASIIYRDELDGMTAATDGPRILYTLTRERPVVWSGALGWVDRVMLERIGFPPTDDPLAYVCGPTPFVEQVAADLVALGYAEERIRTERFGPTGAN